MSQQEHQSYRSVPDVHGRSAASPSVGPVAATLAGVVLGPLDLLAQTTLPYPWANLANSGAVWALGAFVIGLRSQHRARSAAAAGLILLVVAVESYYLAAVIFLHDSATTLWSATTAVWLVLAVVVGAIFGVAGSLIEARRPGIRLAAAALAGLVFLAEAAHTLRGSSGGQSSRPDIQSVLLDCALGVLVPLVLLTVTRARRP